MTLQQRLQHPEPRDGALTAGDTTLGYSSTPPKLWLERDGERTPLDPDRLFIQLSTSSEDGEGLLHARLRGAQLGEPLRLSTPLPESELEDLPRLAQQSHPCKAKPLLDFLETALALGAKRPHHAPDAPDDVPSALIDAMEEAQQASEERTREERPPITWTWSRVTAGPITMLILGLLGLAGCVWMLALDYPWHLFGIPILFTLQGWRGFFGIPKADPGPITHAWLPTFYDQSGPSTKSVEARGGILFVVWTLLFTFGSAIIIMPEESFVTLASGIVCLLFGGAYAYLDRNDFIPALRLIFQGRSRWVTGDTDELVASRRTQVRHWSTSRTYTTTDSEGRSVTKTETTHYQDFSSRLSLPMQLRVLDRKGRPETQPSHGLIIASTCVDKNTETSSHTVFTWGIPRGSRVRIATPPKRTLLIATGSFPPTFVLATRLMLATAASYGMIVWGLVAVLA